MGWADVGCSWVNSTCETHECASLESFGSPIEEAVRSYSQFASHSVKLGWIRKDALDWIQTYGCSSAPLHAGSTAPCPNVAAFAYDANWVRLQPAAGEYLPSLALTQSTQQIVAFALVGVFGLGFYILDFVHGFRPSFLGVLHPETPTRVLRGGSHPRENEVHSDGR